MKNTKRLLAVLLALVMALSCLAGLSFADNGKARPDTEAAKETETAQPAEGRGFKSNSFRLNNSYQYADDEIVLAIVLLDSKAPAELPEAQRTAAASRVAAQHNTLRNALSREGIRYSVEFEYDTLLNGYALSVAYGDLDKIDAISGVKAVYIANEYAAPVMTPATRMASSNVMTGIDVFQKAGYDGKGMVIAVLDTGITPDHEAFQVYGDKLGDVTLTEETAKAFIEEKGYGTYHSEKIPFAFDYYDKDNDATDDKSGHGTHVSGIAAGYAETEEGEITFCGTAPYAQIVAMKVFSSGSEAGTNSGIYFAALEDCYELGVDVINMSLGAQNGNTYDYELEDEVFGNVYQTLEDNGIILCAAAGNEYSMAQYAANWTGGGYVTSDYTDYGVVGSPSTYDGNMSVASVENAEFPGYVLKAGEKEIPYYDSEGTQFYEAMAGKENLEFVVIDGFGAPEDFAGVDVKGKVALISRGDITFQEKVDNAAAAGALAVLVYNNQPGVIYMSIDPYAIPAASITQEDGEYLISIAEMPEVTEPEEPTPEEPTSAGTFALRRAGGERKAATRALDANIVTDASELTDGLYLIANYDLDKVFNGAAGEDINKAANYVVFDDASDAELSAAALTYSSADKSLKTSDGKYIYGIDGSNSMNAGDEPVAMEITFGEGGTAAITNNNTQLAFNSSWDGFRFYKSSSSLLANEDAGTVLVKLTGTGYEPPVPPEPVARPIGKISFPTEQVILQNPDGWLMSDFSSWGVTPVLTLKPQISGIGGDVYSASFGTTDGYEIMSGTSMATPNLTGIMADVSEYIDANISSLASNPFVDVAAGRFYYAPVLWAVGNGVTKGLTETTFGPDGNCTRGQVVTFLWRALGEPKAEKTETSFTDIEADKYYYNAVLWAVEAGVTKGLTETTFGPNATCTRGQVVTFLHRALGEPEATSKEHSFTDVNEKAYYYNAMLWAVENGVTTGKTETTFVPNGICNRGEVVTFLYRALAKDTGLTKVERAELAEKLTQSTAEILTDADGYLYSPRKQGAGLANMRMLTAASAYITEPIQNLFDNTDGEFEFTFTVKDLYGKGQTYQVTPFVQSDYAMQGDLNQDETPETYNSLTALDLATEPYTVKDEEGNETEYPADVEVDAPETVTVPANGEVEVTVKIKLTDETKAYLDAMFPNGAYIEGFIVLDAVEGEGDDAAITEEIHATYVGYYGDWTKAPIMEDHDWRDIVDAQNYIDNTVVDADGNTYADYGYTGLDAVDWQINTGLSLAYVVDAAVTQAYAYAGDNAYGYDPELEYSDARIAINNVGTSPLAALYMTPYNVRNVRHLVMIVSNAETGEIYYVDDNEYLPKAYFDNDYAAWMNSGTFVYDGTDANGEPVPDGTKVNIEYYANLMYGEDEIGKLIGEDADYSKMLAEGKDFIVWSYPCTIDNSSPELVGEPVIDKEAGTVTIKVKDDNYVAAVFMLDENDEVIDQVYLAEAEAGAETELTFEYPEGATFVKFALCDYAANESPEYTAFIEEPTWVTINFSHPEGTELTDYEDEYVAYVGEKLVLPAVDGETEQGYFAAWSKTELPDLLDEDTFWDEFYTEENVAFDGDEVTVTEDMDGTTYYALYEVPGELAPYTEMLTLVEEDLGDWTGVYAIDGYDWNAEERPFDYFLASDLSAKVETDDTYVQYSFFGGGTLYGATEDMGFEFAAAGDGYSIKAISTGKYLAVVDGALALADTADETAIWDVSYVDSAYGNVLTNSDLALTFNENEKTFLLVDPTEVDLTAYEPCNLCLYAQTPGEYFYTTNPNQELPDDPDPDPDPDPAGFVLATELNDGDQVVIYNVANELALSTTLRNTYYREGVAVTIEDDAIAEPDATAIWTVEETEGGFKLKDAEGNYLSMQGTYNSIPNNQEHDVWTLQTDTDGNVYIVNVNAPAGSSGDPRAIEYYNNQFTAYYLTTGNAAFIMQLFVQAGE